MRGLSFRQYGDHPNHPTIVLLAGAYANLASWPLDFAHAMVDHHARVLALDHRDTGRNHPWPTAPFTLDDMADDVLHTLRIHRVKHAHLFGVSMGGAIALRAALRDTDARVASLSLFATTAERCLSPDTLSPPSMRAVASLHHEMSLHERGQIKAALSLRHSGDDQIVKRILQHGYNARPMHGHAFVNAEPIERLDAVQQPTLLMHNQDDPLLPVDHAWHLHHRLPRSRLHLLPFATHALPDGVDARRRMAQLVVEHALCVEFEMRTCNNLCGAAMEAE